MCIFQVHMSNIDRTISPLVGVLCGMWTILLSNHGRNRRKTGELIIHVVLFISFQARRSNTSGPLGQICDHGSDAISTGFYVTTLMILFRLGNDQFFMACAMFVAQFTFFVAQWKESITGCFHIVSCLFRSFPFSFLIRCYCHVVVASWCFI